MKKISDEVGVCPNCGKTQSGELPPHHLIPGTLLNGRYLVGRALGEGGFGITYIGLDTLFDMRVAIKEYYPNGFATRSSQLSTNVSSTYSSDKEFYNKGKTRFLDEAKTLARFCDEEGIVSVRDYFEANNTAYIIMEYLDGITLRDHIAKKGKLSQQETLKLLAPVMESLKKIHEQGLIHRDISPDNIMLTGKRVKLLDFGAARNISMMGSKSLSVQLKPGYAPEEQYRSRGQQGPWTDIYALCATMYKCITGITPDDAAQRIYSDEVAAPSSLGINIASNVEAAIMKGMSVFHRDRFQTIEELQAALIQDDTKTVAMQEIEATGIAGVIDHSSGSDDDATQLLDENSQQTEIIESDDNQTAFMDNYTETVVQTKSTFFEKHPEKRNRMLILTILVSALLVVGLVALFLLSRSCSNKNRTLIYVPTERPVPSVSATEFPSTGFIPTEYTESDVITGTTTSYPVLTSIPVTQKPLTTIPITDVPATDLPTSTLTLIPSPTSTHNPTATSTRTPTPTPTPTRAPSPTSAPTRVPTPTPTATPAPTDVVIIVSFDGNGGTVSSASGKVTYNSTYGTLPAPTRAGYAFDGWYTSASGGSKVTSSTMVATTSNHTLYAHWIANTYTVTFNANGGSGSMSNQSFTYGTAQNLRSNSFTRTNCAFLGWSTSSSATSAMYTNGQSVNNLTSTAKGTVQLYAVWESVTFDSASVTLTRQPNAIKISNSSITLATTATSDYSSSQTLTASVSGYSSPTKTIIENVSSGASVIWSSSDTNVATVSNGVVTAKGNGTATIMASTTKGAKATCSVTVTAGSAAINWTSSETSVASVSSGTVKALKKGTATITASTSNGTKAVCTVKVGKTYKAIALNSTSAYADTNYTGFSNRGFYIFSGDADASVTATFVTGNTIPEGGCIYQISSPTTSMKNTFQIFFTSGKVTVKQGQSGTVSTAISNYTLLPNTKYTVVVTMIKYKKLPSSGTIVIKDENGIVLDTTQCSYNITCGSNGASNAAIGAKASILNGVAPNIKLLYLKLVGTQGASNYATETFEFDCADLNIGASTITSGNLTAKFTGTSVQTYVLF